MELEELIEKYRITLSGENLRLLESGNVVDIDIIRKNKKEIIAILKERIAMKEKRNSQIEWMENHGVREINDAINDWDNWHYEYEKSFEHCGGLGVRPKPTSDIKALREKYPEADAYLKIKALSYSYNFEYASVGKKYLEKILDNPSSYKILLDEMKEEESKITKSHLWD